MKFKLLLIAKLIFTFAIQDGGGSEQEARRHPNTLCILVNLAFSLCVNCISRVFPGIVCTNIKWSKKYCR